MEQTTVLCPNGLSLKYFRSKILGSGGYGSVFKGEYNKKEVAVKRVELARIKDSREETALKKLDHENIVKLLYRFDNDDFRFFLLELCAADLEAFCTGNYTGPRMPSDVEVLLQLAKGLDYIHVNKLVHRDIKPKNILISKTSPVVMKWADFGLTKSINTNGSCSMSGFRGTLSWAAHEVLRLRHHNGRGNKQSDIFSTGCVFFYFLTRGVHPFGGNQFDIENSVSNETKPINITIELANDPFMNAVIMPMIIHKSEERIKLTDVIKELENPPSIPTNLLGRLKTDVLVASVSSGRDDRLSNDEYIIPIKDLLEGKRKKSGWVIHAQVTEKLGPFYQEVLTRRGIPPRKCFSVMLQDTSGNIEAKASTSNLVDKFYSQLQVGKQYFIKKAELKKSSAVSRSLSLRNTTEVSLAV